jgi:hypothetical protein
MTSSRAVPTVFCVALLGAMFSASARADDRDKKTTLTFSAPVEIPPVYITGMRVLPAGTYVFKLMNSSSNRHIVQVFNKEQTKIIATILAIPNYRLVPTGDTVITFKEGVRGRPEAIRAWFYPGADWGEEFVYPNAKALELAKATNEPVLALRSEVTAEVAKPEEAAVATELERVPVMAVKPSGEEVELAQVIQSERSTPAIATSAPTQLAENKLPATASSLPLIALCGLLALGGALTIRFSPMLARLRPTSNRSKLSR